MRLTRGLLLALLLSVASSPAAMGQETTGSAWPQFRRTPTLTGVAGAPLPDTLRVLWMHDAGSPVESSAAIVGDVAYVGLASGELIALDVATGAGNGRAAS